MPSTQTWIQDPVTGQWGQGSGNATADSQTQFASQYQRALAWAQEHAWDPHAVAPDELSAAMLHDVQSANREGLAAGALTGGVDNDQLGAALSGQNPYGGGFGDRGIGGGGPQQAGANTNLFDPITGKWIPPAQAAAQGLRLDGSRGAPYDVYAGNAAAGGGGSGAASTPLNPLRDEFTAKLMQQLENPGLSEDTIAGIVNRGNDGISRSQQSAQRAMAGSVAANGGSAGSGSYLRGQQDLESNYAGQKAGNSRDVRLGAAQSNQQQLMQALGLSAGYLGKQLDNQRSDRSDLIRMLMGSGDNATVQPGPASTGYGFGGGVNTGRGPGSFDGGSYASSNTWKTPAHEDEGMWSPYSNLNTQFAGTGKATRQADDPSQNFMGQRMDGQSKLWNTDRVSQNSPFSNNPLAKALQGKAG